MIRKALLHIIITGGALLLSSCAGEFTTDNALSTIKSQDEFNTIFCAPIHIGNEVLTGENYTNPKRFVEQKYGKLVKAGLVTAQIGEKNSWRTLLNIILTEDGEELLNSERTEAHRKTSKEKDIFFVGVCSLMPTKITRVDTLAQDTIQVTYTIIEHEITPFGEFLGFTDGDSHTHKRKFTKGTFSWDLVPMQ